MASTELLMTALSKRYGGSFSLRDGVCALADAQRQEAVVIEMPVGAGSVMLHCMMGDPVLSTVTCRQILEMNFSGDQRAGCWLALDGAGKLRLCAQMPIVVLTEVVFCDWVSGFMKVVVEMRDRLRILTERAPRLKPAMRNGPELA